MDDLQKFFRRKKVHFYLGYLNITRWDLLTWTINNSCSDPGNKIWISSKFSSVAQSCLTLCNPMNCSTPGLPVHPKGNQSWIFIGRTDSEAETPILWPSDSKNWLIGKDSDAGKDWRWEEKGTTEDEVVGWYHWLNGHEFEWTPGVGDEQGGLACCDSWGHKESDWATELNWTELSEIDF